MKVVNIGSLNIDYVYSVDHIILPGETESTGSRNIYPGGKGINQSCALAKAGACVYHAGLIGEDGRLFIDVCRKYGVKDSFLRIVDGPSGHTVIQIDKQAQNNILLYGGANQRFTTSYIDEVLEHFSSQDLLLLQNEINLLPYIVDKAFEKGMQIALNPSPFNEKLQAVDLQKISLFLLNEVEGYQLTGQTAPLQILQELRNQFPQARIVLTLGKDGAVYADQTQEFFQPIFPVKAVDTTAAGDTFTGYFLAGLTEGIPIQETLRISAKAASIAVTREGAIPSIPYRQEVLDALERV